MMQPHGLSSLDPTGDIWLACPPQLGAIFFYLPTLLRRIRTRSCAPHVDLVHLQKDNRGINQSLARAVLSPLRSFRELICAAWSPRRPSDPWLPAPSAGRMDGFSVASVSATCSSLSNRALSASIELDEILDYGSIGRPASEKLAALLVTLNEFKQSVEELRERLNASPTITDGLQQVLIESLPDCDSVAAIMSKQVKRIGPETPTELINLAALAGYEGLLASHARLFKLEIQLLSMYVHIADVTRA
ncbi:hypothetical protein GQ53DRAFT_454260 [Thozetella sp. PMI_491]|nr:hypothetical protein GQ53DRAFT_454260 [Thozetella sp. PMI_491]